MEHVTEKSEQKKTLKKTWLIVGHHSTGGDKRTQEIMLLLTSYSPTKLGPRQTGWKKDNHQIYCTCNHKLNRN